MSDLSHDLTVHLTRTYGVPVTSATLLRGGDQVFRVDLHDQPPWVARVFRPHRPAERVLGDAEILRFVAEHDFPAERLAHDEPASSLDGQTVLITRFVDGSPGDITPEHEFTLADMLGRLHALPAGTPATQRPGGAIAHDPAFEGAPSRDLDASAHMLASIESDVPADGRRTYDLLRAHLQTVDGCDDLPEALTHPDMVGPNVLVTPDGVRLAIDWTGSGRGARLASFAFLLWGAGMKPGGDKAIVDAIAAGYGRHVRLERDELARLRDAMMIRPLYFSVWRCRSAIASGKPLPDADKWLRECEVAGAIAHRAIESLTA